MKDVIIDGLSFSESLILSISKRFTPWRELNNRVLEGVSKYSFPKNKSYLKLKSIFVINKVVDCGIYTGQIIAS